MVEKVEALRMKDKYFVVGDIVNVSTTDGEYFEQVCIDAIVDDNILIDCGEFGNWLKFNVIIGISLF